MRNALDNMPGSARHFDEMSTQINRAVNVAGYYENLMGVSARDWCFDIRNSLAWQAQQKTLEYLEWFNKHKSARHGGPECFVELWARVSRWGTV